MREVLDLRSAKDRQYLADLLPEIDRVLYSIPREEFLDALNTVAELLPDSIPLERRAGMVPIHKTIGSVDALVELGRWFTLLRDCNGFKRFLSTFTNPTQFWDSYFEARVAAHFMSLPSVADVQFSPEVDVRGKRKYPEFLITTHNVGCLFVECKQVHFSEAKASRKFQADVALIESARSGVQWPDDYCLEIEFQGPEREAFFVLAKRVVEKAVEVARTGGGVFELGNMRATVRHREQPLAMNTQQRDTLYTHILRSPGYPITLADARHMPLSAKRGGINKRYLRLFHAALADARTQLPSDRPTAICVSGIPMQVVRQFLDPYMSSQTLPANFRFVSAWDGNTFQLYADQNSVAYVESLFGIQF